MDKELFLRISSTLVLLPIIFFLILKGENYFLFLIILCFIIATYEWYNMIKSKIFFYSGLLFLILSFYSAFIIRNDFQGDYIYFIIIISICICSDVGGYIFGKVIKGPKLIKISPNKTIAGVVGAYVISTIFVLLILNNFFNIYQIQSIKNLLIFTFIVSTVSQIGDIIISNFKRISKIKDTGKIIPGHGGILDRIDGMIFVFPVSCLLLLSDFNLGFTV